MQCASVVIFVYSIVRLVALVLEGLEDVLMVFWWVGVDAGLAWYI